MNPAGTVVLVHGLFYGWASLSLLGRRLRNQGFVVAHFAHAPTRAGLDGSADELVRLVNSRERRPVHCVGHSFGGLVILSALAGDVPLPPGRVVLLGSPVQGSRVARRLMHWAPGRALLRAAGPALAGGFVRLPPDREVGMIAGSVSLGLGRLTGARLGASDGTVAVDEADAPGLTDRRVLGVSHTGMVLSRRVAGLVGEFLRTGRFGGPHVKRQSPVTGTAVVK